MIQKSYLIDLNTLDLSSEKKVREASDFLWFLQKQNLPFVLIDTDCSHTREQICDRMNRSGFQDIHTRMLYTSAMAAVDEAVQINPHRRTAGYLGPSALRSTIEAGGFSIVQDRADWMFLAMDRNAGLPDYGYALRLIENGAVLISLDSSRTSSVEGQHTIGTGALCAMLEYASDKRAVQIGMPSPVIAECARRYLGADAEDCILVGGNLDTDIACGTAARMETVLVTENQEIIAEKLRNGLHPTYLVENLSGLMR